MTAKWCRSDTRYAVADNAAESVQHFLQCETRGGTTYFTRLFDELLVVVNTNTEALKYIVHNFPNPWIIGKEFHDIEQDPKCV